MVATMIAGSLSNDFDYTTHPVIIAMLWASITGECDVYYLYDHVQRINRPPGEYNYWPSEQKMRALLKSGKVYINHYTAGASNHSKFILIQSFQELGYQYFAQSGDNLIAQTSGNNYWGDRTKWNDILLSHGDKKIFYVYEWSFWHLWNLGNENDDEIDNENEDKNFPHPIYSSNGVTVFFTPSTARSILMPPKSYSLDEKELCVKEGSCVTCTRTNPFAVQLFRLKKGVGTRIQLAIAFWDTNDACTKEVLGLLLEHHKAGSTIQAIVSNSPAKAKWADLAYAWFEKHTIKSSIRKGPMHNKYMILSGPVLSGIEILNPLDKTKWTYSSPKTILLTGSLNLENWGMTESIMVVDVTKEWDVRQSYLANFSYQWKQSAP